MTSSPQLLAFSSCLTFQGPVLAWVETRTCFLFVSRLLNECLVGCWASLARFTIGCFCHTPISANRLVHLLHLPTPLTGVCVRLFSSLGSFRQRLASCETGARAKTNMADGGRFGMSLRRNGKYFKAINSQNIKFFAPKSTCPVGQAIGQIHLPKTDFYLPRASGQALMSSIDSDL